MDRVLISIGPITIYWYSFLIFLSILIGLLIVKKEVVKTKLDKGFIFDLIFYLIPVAIVGARIYYVIFNYSVFKDNFIDVFKIWEGGLAIYGAVIAGILFTIYYCKKKKQSILLTLDILAPCLVLGQAIGRWGKYINGNYYIPTFLFESIWCFIVFIILIIVRNKLKYKKEGIIVCLYFILYSLGRFFIEGLRTDSLYIFNFRVSQIVAIILIIIGIVGIVILEKKGDNNEKV